MSAAGTPIAARAPPVIAILLMSIKSSLLSGALKECGTTNIEKK